MWPEYQDQGVVIWGIGSQDDLDTLEAFRDQMGITFPILYDADGAVHSDYSMQNAFGGTLYPEDWIVGVDGTVVYLNNGYDADAIRAVLDAELAKSR
ncbi:MAG: redoxin domain-containing protein [Myxococcota bacterium]|nr:redoxin domain-containing protein [Myxococcota bacterium]